MKLDVHALADVSWGWVFATFERCDVLGKLPNRRVTLTLREEINNGSTSVVPEDIVDLALG